MVSTARSEQPTPGLALELTILDLFRSSGFRAQRNSAAARPRQTDIYAQGPGLDLLVEVKG